MSMLTIDRIDVRDVRFKLNSGEGADAVHSDPSYSYAVTLLHSDQGVTGTGLAFTLGAGNDLVCGAIEGLAPVLVGREIEALMLNFGATFREIADHPQYRWLGPHKGVVHLALASITNACFDLWAKSRGVPLWQLLLNLTPQQTINLLDFSYIEDVITPDEAHDILARNANDRPKRMNILRKGYPGYDTSVGWFHYSDEYIRERSKKALDEGFRAIKLKVGSKDTARDVRRTNLVREVVGDDVDIMLDVNQQWTLPQAIRTSIELTSMNPYWIEEPTHPDDILAHQTIARAIAPTPVAVGEHISHRILFKNFIQANAMQICQVDCTRVGGVSEFITISLMARKFGIPVVPHVGDMGQIHQHLVLFNHVVLGHECLFLEYIPHLREHFWHPAEVTEGVYVTPEIPGSSSDLK